MKTINKSNNKNYYQNKKEEVVNEAIEYQFSFNENSYSWADLLEKSAYFERMAKRYGLIKEFKENGIL